MTTPTVEAYLEIIYMMATERQPVIGARLADTLQVSRPTITATLRRMVRDGFVKLDEQKRIQLTAKGQSIAEHLQRRHRIVERWLTDVLGMDWAKSDAEAHRLEHAMSDDILELLNKHIGYPTTCPHGNPIPGNTRHVLADNKTFQIHGTRAGDCVTVVRISEYGENVNELLDYLGTHGVIPGASVTIMEIAPFKGPLTLRTKNKVFSMSREIANFVWVKSV